MDRHTIGSSRSQWSNEEVSEKMNALQESLEKLKLHQQRLAESLLDPATVERVARYMVSAFRRPTSRLQGRKLEFSPTGVHDVDVPIFSTAPASPIRSVDDGLISQRSVDVSVPLVDSDIELQKVEAPRGVVAVSVETVNAIVTTNTSHSLKDGIIIGDLYVSCNSVSPMQEAIAYSGGTDACMQSPSFDVGDLGDTTELVDEGSYSSIIDSQVDVESCVQSQVLAVEALLGDVKADSMDTFDDIFDDAMSCIGYNIPCQVLDDDSKEVLDGS